MSDAASKAPRADVKQCCAAFYGSDYARFLLGDSFHPGGTKLTHELGKRLALGPPSRVLDVACGRGTSAIYLAESFGCKVVGIDLSEQSVDLAREAASDRRLDTLARFEVADAESLPFSDESFSAIVCECAFCTFPDKATAAREFYRVLEENGSIGLTDLTKGGATPPELESLLAWIACIGDAQPVRRYQEWLIQGGFHISEAHDRSDCLKEMVRQVRARMLLADVMIGLNKLLLPDLDLDQSKEFLAAVSRSLGHGELGYMLLTGAKGGNPFAHGCSVEV